jgi:hypothetical protein
MRHDLCARRGLRPSRLTRGLARSCGMISKRFVDSETHDPIRTGYSAAGDLGLAIALPAYGQPELGRILERERSAVGGHCELGGGTRDCRRCHRRCVRSTMGQEGRAGSGKPG